MWTCTLVRWRTEAFTTELRRSGSEHSSPTAFHPVPLPAPFNPRSFFVFKGWVNHYSLYSLSSDPTTSSWVLFDVDSYYICYEEEEEEEEKKEEERKEEEGRIYMTLENGILRTRSPSHHSSP